MARKNYLSKTPTLDELKKDIPKGGLQDPSLRKQTAGINYDRARKQGVIQGGTITGDFGNLPGSPGKRSSGKRGRKARGKGALGFGNFKNVTPKIR